MSKTSISWSEFSWNVSTGCTPASAGCANCYAKKMAERLKLMGQAKYSNGFLFTLHPECLDEPLKRSNPTLWFVDSMSDLFHEDMPFEFIDEVMNVISQCPQHRFQLLTKRAERMREYWESRNWMIPQNIWLGITCEDSRYKYRIDYLRDLPAAVKWISMEPLVGDLGELDLTGIDWVVVGGESGRKATVRPMQKDWVYNIKNQADAQGVLFFFKQIGAYGFDGVYRSTKANGCELDGIEYKAMPKF